MVFEYILKQHNIDPQKDLTIVQNIDFGSTAAAFSEGQADYTVEFEPGATSLETGRKGYVVASLGTDSGYVPYTAFSARKSYIQRASGYHPGICKCSAERNGLCTNTHTTRNRPRHCTSIPGNRPFHNHHHRIPIL